MFEQKCNSFDGETDDQASPEKKVVVGEDTHGTRRGELNFCHDYMSAEVALSIVAHKTHTGMSARRLKRPISSRM